MRFLTISVCALVALAACFVSPRATAQDEKPILQIDADTPAFAIAPDNRVAYAVRHQYHTKKYDLERDEIWIATLDGKKVLIAGIERHNEDEESLSYRVRHIVWSPDAHHIAVETEALEVTDARGNARELEKVFVFADTDRDVNPALMKSGVLDDAWQPSFLSDNATLVYLTEAVKPKKLWRIQIARAPDYSAKPLAGDATVADAAVNSKGDTVYAVLRAKDSDAGGKFVAIDPQNSVQRDLALLPAYHSALSVSPSGRRIAFYRDGDNIEVRDVASPEKAAAIVHAPLGVFGWSRDEAQLLVKRGGEKESGTIAWIRIADSQPQPILHGLPYGDFQISPNGQYLGIFEPGRYGFQIIPLPMPGS